MKTINTISHGFVYNPNTMEVVSDFIGGVVVSTPDYNEFFYGTKDEAIAFGIIFEEEILENE